MSTTTTPDFGTPLVASSQAQPEITHNEAIRRVEVLAAGIALARRTAPIGDEEEGDVLIVDGVGSDDFEGQDNKIAFLWGGSWRFIPDVDGDGEDIAIGARHAGLRFFVQDDGSSPPAEVEVRWTGASWVEV
jgi:hypothetical protein